MTFDEYKAKVFEAGGVIGSLAKKFLIEKLNEKIPKYLKHRYCVGCFRFLEICRKHNFSVPCQELYNLALENREHAQFYYISQLTRFIDAECQTHAVDSHNGLPLNDSFNLNEEECDAFFTAAKLPLVQAPVGFIITMAMRGLVLFENSQSTKGQYLRMFRILAGYCRIHNDGYCSKKLADEFVSKAEMLWHDKKIRFWKLKLARRVAAVAKQILETGSYSEWWTNKRTAVLPGDLERVRQAISKYCHDMGNSIHTIENIDYGFRKFIELTGISSAEEIRKLTPEHAVEVVAKLNGCCTTSGSRHAVTRFIKKALTILFKGGFIIHDLSKSIVLPRLTSNCVIGYLTESDESKLASWLEAGKESLRNKAFILLALRLGLRDSDIRSLRFENIDWKKEKISFVQNKTGEVQTLPLLPEVGNAVWDYITGERPHVSNCQYVFLKAQAPFQPLSSGYNPVSRILKKLNLTPQNRNTLGPHMLRHTLIKNLLHKETPHQHITDVLGHRSHNSDRSYYAISEKKLKECAQDLSVIGVPIWMEEVRDE